MRRGAATVVPTYSERAKIILWGVFCPDRVVGGGVVDGGVVETGWWVRDFWGGPDAAICLYC